MSTANVEPEGLEPAAIAEEYDPVEGELYESDVEDWRTLDADDDPALALFGKSQRDLVTSVVDYNLETLSNLVSRKKIDLSPRYQRRFRWDAARQSKLIESFLMNVPIPPIFLNEDRYGTYAVIDGKQRLFAIQEFLRGRVAIAASVSARRGFTAVPLAQAVPRAAGWRLSSLPRALETEQVARLLESCDRTTAIERRDHPPMAGGGAARTVTLKRPEEPRCPPTTS